MAWTLRASRLAWIARPCWRWSDVYFVCKAMVDGGCTLIKAEDMKRRGGGEADARQLLVGRPAQIASNRRRASSRIWYFQSTVGHRRAIHGWSATQGICRESSMTPKKSAALSTMPTRIPATTRFAPGAVHGAK